MREKQERAEEACVQGRGHALTRHSGVSFVDSWGPCKDFGLILLIALGDI